ncbi:NADH:ubiquinone reductase (H(+)-translocating) [Trypanosoma rangeli]|uniref:NADH:ubiquinone reductase (H(+)-translocating) n=1 Tax=Trypanosoma rangeli TaxID=5698 RepID=A0A3R7MVN3_TRYRA|nr:NADH:ubiquinone reductase (H(+)-translocating) [Trypanosoma rangeli]RNF12036.1 NADH:ubiquinone reductase (H(+)-translocating) [Trypanosoma rangeli]|eukprot:RNF12036.1 NADH:ubiquinone reductase (H(+)-translocating) [Trypanosoma rangeli]
MVEPVDPHWFREQAPYTTSPMWLKWMQGNAAHTPAQMKARGEWDHTSLLGMPLPLNIKYDEFSLINADEIFSRDTMWVAAPCFLVNPERRALEEAGYSR